MASKKIKTEAAMSTHLPHSCFKCSARFANSGQLVQHMKEQHSSFVVHAKPRAAISPPPPPHTAEKDEPTTSSSLKNTIATCPFCRQDCLTRKKLMKHLELEHKDDNDQDEEPDVKVLHMNDQNQHTILDQTHSQDSVTNSHKPAHDSSAAQALLKSSSSSSAAKGEGRIAAKLQYKCFWCDASFRKRGKLMDHIDSLHKQSKHQNQVEAEMLNYDDSGKVAYRPATSQTASAPFTQSPAPVERAGALPFGPSDIMFKGRPHTVTNNCSFLVMGPFTASKKIKLDTTVPNMCKFYYGKRGNPIANMRIAQQHQQHKMAVGCNNSRRYSLPTSLENTMTGPYGIPLRMMPTQSSMASAMQHSYMFGMRPRHAFIPAPFYPMPMMLPGADCVAAVRPNSYPDHRQSPSPQTLIRMANFTSLNHVNKVADGPLDLSKGYAGSR